jgi:acyl carrier protein
MSIAAQVKQRLAKVCALNPAQITDDARLIEFGLDSLRSMELIVELEEHFAIELDDQAIVRVRTVADLIRLIEQQRSTDGEPSV